MMATYHLCVDSSVDVEWQRTERRVGPLRHWFNVIRPNNLPNCSIAPIKPLPWLFLQWIAKQKKKKNHYF